MARSDPERVVKAQTEISDWVRYSVKTVTIKVEQMRRVEKGYLDRYLVTTPRALVHNQHTKELII